MEYRGGVIYQIGNKWRITWKPAGSTTTKERFKQIGPKASRAQAFAAALAVMDQAVGQ